jgi:hypothetical protein
MKRINVRIEHVRPSKCRSDFLSRVKEVDSKLREAKKAGVRLPVSAIKRAPTAPKAAFQVSRATLIKSTVTTLKPKVFDDMLVRDLSKRGCASLKLLAFTLPKLTQLTPPPLPTFPPFPSVLLFFFPFPLQ